MLQLVFGRSGYGKTEYIRNRIADKIDRGETQVLLITPEQYYQRVQSAGATGGGTSARRSMSLLFAPL